jgi:hypothetical protein
MGFPNLKIQKNQVRREGLCRGFLLMIESERVNFDILYTATFHLSSWKDLVRSGQKHQVVPKRNIYKRI